MDKEYEIKALAQIRMRFMASAQHACSYGLTPEEWLSDDMIKDFIKKYFLEDEVEHFVSYVWKHFNN